MWTEAKYDIELFNPRVNKEAYRKVLDALHNYTNEFKPNPDLDIPVETQKVSDAALWYLDTKGADADKCNLVEEGCIRVAASQDDKVDDMSHLFGILLPILQKGSYVEESTIEPYGVDSIPLTRTICYTDHKAKEENAIHAYPSQNTTFTVGAFISSLSDDCLNNQHYLVYEHATGKRYAPSELTDDIFALPVIGIGAEDDCVLIHTKEIAL